MHAIRTLFILVICLLHQTARIMSDHVVRPACGPDEETCVFSLVVRHALSMTSSVPTDVTEHKGPVVVFPNGTYAVRTSPDCDSLKFMDGKAISDVLTLDGSYRMVFTVNNEMPGPPIVVYGGQEVVVNVTNELLSEAMTMHWHGQHQMGTPWMDGTGGVTQCTIAPRETFTYRFVAHPSGTFWYHAHEGVQRTEGIYGAFIVLPGTESIKHKVTKEKYPELAGDYVMALQDFYQQSSQEVFMQWVMAIGRYANHYGDLNQCFDDRLNVDGYQNTYIPPRSVLINGRGWHYKENSTVPENTGIPLEVYKVKTGHNYRFRVINGGYALTLRVSVDSHVLNVMATDGCLVESYAVESIMVAPGEKYDFWISATDPDKTGLYWMRVEGIEWTTTGPNKRRVLPVHAESVLLYNDVKTKWTQSENVLIPNTRPSCSDVKPCLILNCPYQYYPPEEHMICIPVTSLTPAIPERPLLSREGDVTYNNFLHLHYTGSDDKSFKRMATIDSKLFKVPVIPPQIYPQSPWAGGDGVCMHEDPCEKEVCPCTHIMKVAMGSVVQITIMVMAHKHSSPASHPMHLHGHSFQVIKIGYPKYDVKTGHVLSQSEDVVCADGEMPCHHPGWRNASWDGGKLQDVAESVIRKDTVAIPVGGYVVIRFETTNPGFWFFHCHMAFHAAQGMALIIQEGELEQMPATPDHFQTCGSFVWSDQDFRKLTNFKYKGDAYQVDIAAQKHYNIPSSNSNIPPAVYHGVRAALIVTVSLLMGAIFVCLVLLYKLKKVRHGYAAVSSGVSSGVSNGMFSSDEYSPD